MSHYPKRPGAQQEASSTYDSLANRFRDSLDCNSGGDSNKPDFKELDLGSPVSPLTTSARGVASVSSSSNNAATSSTSSSSSSSSDSVCSNKSGSNSNAQLVRRQENNGGSCGHSGELSETSPVRPDYARSGPNTRDSRSVQSRSSPAAGGLPLIYSGSSFGSSAAATTSNANHCNSSNGATSICTSACSSGSSLLPSGNICPSGKVLKTGFACRVAHKTGTLGSGTGHYGHGSIMRGGGGGGGPGGGGGGGSGVKLASGGDPEEMKRAGNEMYKRGNFVEALALYDKAIQLSPENAAYRSNRAAALTAIGRLGEAVRECEEAVRLDPGYARAHQRLASLYFRLGHVDNARHHLSFHGLQQDPAEFQRLQSLEKHISRCADARKIGDWKSALSEADAALTIGADSSPQLVACRAEAFLKMHQLEDADSTISNIPKFESYSPQTRFFGMVGEAYVLFVQAQIEMALGRFENAASVAEKAGLTDCSNVEVATVSTNVKMVARARNRGYDLFSSGRYSEASLAYGEGLKYDPTNSILYCNRAVCWSKLGLWEKSVEDCNQALRVQPNYTKALLRRAASNGKLGRWAEAVKDYEVLRKELPGDNEVVDSLHRAQMALIKCRGEVYDTKFGGEVEEVSTLDKFKAVISSPGVSVVHFKAASDEQCEDISPFINMLCVRYPSVHFFKVDVEESLAVARAESIRTVPVFKIFRNGDKLKEIIRPSHQFLEDCVRRYSV